MSAIASSTRWMVDLSAMSGTSSRGAEGVSHTRSGCVASSRVLQAGRSESVRSLAMTAPLDAAFATHASGRRREGGRVALVAGAVGRLGEALLNASLARGGYDRVVVLAEAPLALGIDGLELRGLDALPRLDD